MSDQNPFANWPHLDKPGEPRRAMEPLPGSPNSRDEFMAPNKPLENFLGGSPATVFLRLLFLSLVVGALLMWLNLHPRDILQGLRNFVDSIYAMGFDAVRMIFEYVAAGAVIVVPVWFVLRLLGAGRR
jgi:hypothetical protein